MAKLRIPRKLYLSREEAEEVISIEADSIEETLRAVFSAVDDPDPGLQKHRTQRRRVAG